ncbi:MAG: hypothetical protein KAX64_00260 [Chromatiaceae bacterium]|nr:hypothetical protein [Chromatiaceae bacterium]
MDEYRPPQKGYHLPMRMAHLFNTLARFAQHLKPFYAQLGARGVIAFIRHTCQSPWLDAQRVGDLLARPLLLHLE